MNEIIEKNVLTEKAFTIKIKNTYLSMAKPGQYAILQFKEDSDRIPLSIMDASEKEGWAEFLIEVRGKSTLELFAFSKEGEKIYYIEGPGGKPPSIKKFQNALFVSQGWGIGPLFNLAKAFRKDFNPRMELIHFYENNSLRLEALPNKIFHAFDVSKEINNLSYLENAISSNDYKYIFSAGSNFINKFIAEKINSLSKEINLVSLPNIHILDSIGICLVCRVIMKDGERALACVDGPWFDGLKVNWDNLIVRENLYKDIEQKAYEEMEREVKRKLERR